jgi:hypothetical protein
VIALALALAAAAGAPDAQQVLKLVLDGDPWGLNEAEVQTHGIMKDKRGSVSELRFTALSKRYDPPLSRTLVKISAPAELSGAGFLQTQKRDGDDERFLYLPELKRARRISGSLRQSSFMGTDFSFADVDKRDLRDGKAALGPDEKLGKYDCWHLIITGTREDSEYSRIDLWVRKDNALPILWRMFDRAGEPLKVLTAEEVRRVEGRWFISRSRMQNVREQHETEWIIESFKPSPNLKDDDLSLRSLEKM